MNEILRPDGEEGGEAERILNEKEERSGSVEEGEEEVGRLRSEKGRLVLVRVVS